MEQKRSKCYYANLKTKIHVLHENEGGSQNIEPKLKRYMYPIFHCRTNLLFNYIGNTLQLQNVEN